MSLNTRYKIKAVRERAYLNFLFMFFLAVLFRLFIEWATLGLIMLPFLLEGLKVFKTKSYRLNSDNAFSFIEMFLGMFIGVLVISLG